MKSLVRRILLFGFVAAVAGAIILGLRPAAVEADLAPVVRGDIRETVDQDGRTRLRERYAVSAPLAGRLLRIALDPGDQVEAGETLVASIEPRDPELLDARALLQAEANVKAAEARLERTSPLLDEAVANLEFAEADLQRARQAQQESRGSVTLNELENKEMVRRTRAALVRAAEHAHEIAKFELAQAEAALIRSRPLGESTPDAASNAADAATGDAARTPAPYPQQDPQWHFNIPAPINGRVLRVFRESSGVVAAGDQLLEIGDPLDLEVEIDVLSRDAVKVKPGAPVLLEEWGGERPLHGEVRLVEPSGFTKISTLGVEEQRVNVIVDLVDPPQSREALGDGFRVEARIVTAEAKNALKVPTSALFRAGDDWAVFRVEDGIARQRTIKVGLQNGLEAEVQEGLAEGDLVVTHPGDNVVDGRAVKAR
ncbi:MAG: HlyD family efflux transporter periplasmic adaptor subunit [Planctomycetaceae bacterium]|nr:HlyD family efflux transporter periplasmic adaptor subunit [Planctomycetaceae bacterium]